jgi:hypothetical protein
MKINPIHRSVSPAICDYLPCLPMNLLLQDRWVK